MRVMGIFSLITWNKKVIANRFASLCLAKKAAINYERRIRFGWAKLHWMSLESSGSQARQEITINKSSLRLQKGKASLRVLSTLSRQRLQWLKAILRAAFAMVRLSTS